MTVSDLPPLGGPESEAARDTGARLESLAPPGGVLIGTATFDRLPEGTVVEERRGLRVRGKDARVDAYLLVALP